MIMRTNNVSPQLNEDNYHSIFSYIPLTRLIVFTNLNKTLLNTVKKLIRLSEQNINIFATNNTILSILESLEEQLKKSSAQQADNIRTLTRPLVSWLYTRIQQQKKQPLTFNIITANPDNYTHNHQHNIKPAKLLFDNQLKINIAQPPYTEARPTQRITRPGHLSASGSTCTLYTKKNNRCLSISPHLGQESKQYLNKKDLRDWERRYAIKLKNIISGVNSFVLITEEGDAYGVGMNHSNMFYSKHNNKPLHTPKKIPLPEGCKVIKVALCKRSMAIIDDKGNLYTSGNINAHLNPQQELIDDPVTNATPLMVRSNQKFIDVSIASEHLIALSNQHKLWGLGRNTHNQIGLEDTPIADLHVVTQENASTIVEVNAGKLDHDDQPVYVHTDKFNSFFTTAKGLVFGCGWNLFNVLGLPNKGACYPFTQIPTDREKFFTQVYSHSKTNQPNVFSILATRDRELFWSGQWQVTYQTILKQDKHSILQSNRDFSQSLLARDWHSLSP